MHKMHADLGQEIQSMCTSSTRIGEKYDLGDFDCRRIFGARCAGLTSETADVLGFSRNSL